MTPTTTRVSFFTALSVLFVALPAHAQLHHGDVEVEIEGSQLESHPYTGFQSHLDEEGAAYESDEPGFDSHEGTFTPGSTLGFTVEPITIGGVSRHLWYWDGTGAWLNDSNWGPTPTSPEKHNFEFSQGLFETDITDSTGATPLAGFNFGTADGTGVIHEHLDFAITGTTTGDPGDIAMPVTGVYLTSISLTTSEAGVADSEPLFFLFSSEVEDLRYAEFYVSNAFGAVFAATVPEPGTGLLGGFGLFCYAALRRSRRRRK